MSIISKELVKLGQSHFWLEIEHVGTEIAAKFHALNPISDINAEISTLHTEAQNKLTALQKMPEYAAYHAAKVAYEQAAAAVNPATPPAA